MVLDDKLFQEGSPIAQNAGAVSAYDFDSSTDRNSVNFAKIKNFSFSSGTGGTLTLGGFGDGNGEMIIKDSSGSVVITLDRLGLRGYDGNGTAASNVKFWLDTIDTSIYDGSVSIYDVNGLKSIDIRGVNSINQFANSDLTAFNVLQNFSSTAAVGITGGTLTIANSRISNYLFNYSISAFNDSGTGNCYFSFYEDGAELDRSYAVHFGDYSGNDIETGASHTIVQVPVGTTSYSLRGTQDNGGTTTLYSYVFSYVKLGN